MKAFDTFYIIGLLILVRNSCSSDFVHLTYWTEECRYFHTSVPALDIIVHTHESLSTRHLIPVHSSPCTRRRINKFFFLMSQLSCWLLLPLLHSFLAHDWCYCMYGPCGLLQILLLLWHFSLILEWSFLSVKPASGLYLKPFPWKVVIGESACGKDVLKDVITITSELCTVVHKSGWWYRDSR